MAVAITLAPAETMAASMERAITLSGMVAAPNAVAVSAALVDCSNSDIYFGRAFRADVGA